MFPIIFHRLFQCCLKFTEKLCSLNPNEVMVCMFWKERFHNWASEVNTLSIKTLRNALSTKTPYSRGHLGKHSPWRRLGTPSPWKYFGTPSSWKTLGNGNALSTKTFGTHSHLLHEDIWVYLSTLPIGNTISKIGIVISKVGIVISKVGIVISKVGITTSIMKKESSKDAVEP